MSGFTNFTMLFQIGDGPACIFISLFPKKSTAPDPWAKQLTPFDARCIYGKDLIFYKLEFE